MKDKNSTKIESLHLNTQSIGSITSIGEDLIIADRLDLNRIFPAHFRAQTPICIILRKGWLKGRCNLVGIEASAPCLIIILPEHILEYISASNDVDGRIICMSENFTEQLNIKPDFDFMKALRSNNIIPLNKKAETTMLMYYKMIKRLANYPDHPYLMETAVSLTRAFFFGAGYFIHQMSSPTKLSRKELLANEFLALAKQHCRTERKLDFYAKKMCLSSKYLTAIVASVTGESASKWIDKYVIFEAKAMLATADKTISQISDALNFPDVSTFGKYFKRHVGKSPKAFIKTTV